MKKFLAIVIALIIAFIGGFVTAHVIQPEEEYSIDPEVISQELVEISDLATYQDTYTMTVPYDGGKKSFPIFEKYKIPFSEKSMVVKYNGVLKLGPNLKNLSKDDIDIDRSAKTMKVTLPHSEVLSHEILEDTWEIGDKKNGLFNSLKPEDDSNLRKLAKEQALEEQDIDALLEKADENAEKQIKAFLQIACPKYDIEIEFK
ncbi:MAG: DUF4230 domain-containing protein [Bacillota bacterium]|nr:DUF4230 domain-containing protein [Bacillota bacterium]